MAMTVLEPAQVPGAFQQAFHLMRSGRPGPVLIDLPFDVQMAEIDFDPETYQPLPVYKPAATRAQVERALDLLAAAERPLIVAGGGIINADAADLLVEFAELTGVPVDPDPDGLGRDPRRPPADGGHGRAADLPPLRQRDPARRRTSCSASATAGPTGTPAGWTPTRRGRTFVHVDIEPTQIGRVFAPDYGIVSDAGAALELFVEVAREREPQ